MANALVRTEARGIATHGLTRVPLYLERLRSGQAKARPAPSVQISGPVVQVNADGALGQVALAHALAQCTSVLQQQPMAVCAIRRCGHLGALGIHALAAAESGMFCLLMQRTPAFMSLPGHGQPLIGNNPLAFACPLPGAAPLVFDMACSVAARGQILLARRDGRPIPLGWALDADGEPTTDAEQALHGALLPAAGHKGLGIAMLVECFAGALTGALASMEGGDGQAERQAAVLVLIKPTLWVSNQDFLHAMDVWTRAFRTPGNDDIRLPGQRAARLEHSARLEGLELDEGLLRQLLQVAQDSGIPFPAMDFHAVPSTSARK